MPTTWFLLILCIALALALALTLRQLYRARLAGKDPFGGSGEKGPPSFERIDELLTTMMNLQELGTVDVGDVPREQVCLAALDYACRLINSTRGSLMLLSEGENQLKIVASRGISRDVVENTRLEPGVGVAGKAFQTGQSIFISDPSKDPRYVEYRKNGESQEPFISIPLRIKDRPIGVLNLHQTEGTAPFNDYNLKFLALLAGEIARSLENLSLYDSLQNFYMDLVQSLSRAMDMKDAFTHDHSERAKTKARRIAEEMHLPEQMIRYVEFAALLHDIGKIGIDDSIITKPGRLTPEEYEIMKKHPTIGHQILAPVKFMGHVAQIVLYHQEWYNGKGYPEGLKGEQIPLGARIVAAIDAWDAMISDRPYRRSLGKEKATEELKKGAGTQFDPKVVEIFLKLEESEWRYETSSLAPSSLGSRDL